MASPAAFALALAQSTTTVVTQGTPAPARTSSAAAAPADPSGYVAEFVDAAGARHRRTVSGRTSRRRRCGTSWGGGATSAASVVALGSEVHCLRAELPQYVLRLET
ncbi:hypothetical protein AB0M68_28440 [Streptomyces sp. NPDC051453]|uniref:hypothetical protein n=1 Tax=Streptomyces sp. NPDC051453 TaxID=3154941 RepID=UPI0034441EE0